MNGDTAIMQEIEAFLADYGANRNNFIEFMMEMENPDSKYCLDKANCFKYFRNRPVPLFHLLKIGSHLSEFEWKLDLEESRLHQYRKRVDEIREKIANYIVENRNTPTNIRAEIRFVLNHMDDKEIESLFQSLYVFSISERLWTFWACYSCLGYVAQEDIKEKLSNILVPPTVYVDRLRKFHTWELKVNAPIRAEFAKRYKKYQEQSKTGKEETRKKFIEALVGMLQKYPYAFQDTVHYFKERATQRPENYDMPILMAYSLMCSTLDRAEQSEIDRAIMRYLRDKTYWRPLTTIDWNKVDWNNPPKVELVPEKVVIYFAERFRDCNAV